MGVNVWGFFDEGGSAPYSEEPPCEDPELCAEWDSVLARKDRAAAKALVALRPIPHSRRSRAWALLCDAASRRVPGLFASLAATPRPASSSSTATTTTTTAAAAANEATQDEDSAAVAQILLDLPRSFPCHALVASKRGQLALFDVLRAYALFDPGTNYCQGLAFVAGVLLMVSDVSLAASGKGEGEESHWTEDAFWNLVGLLQGHRLAELYGPGMPGMVRECSLFEHALRLHDPRLADHLEAHGVMPLLYLVPWLVPLFTNLNNWSAIMRAWDQVMADGLSAMRRLALALLVANGNRLLSLPDANELIPVAINPPVADLPAARWLALSLDLKADELFAKAVIIAAGPRTPVAKVTPPPPARKRLRAIVAATAPATTSPRKRKKKDDGGGGEEEVVVVGNAKSGGSSTGGLKYWLRKTLTPGPAAPRRGGAPKSATTAKRPATVARAPIAPRTSAALRQGMLEEAHLLTTPTMAKPDGTSRFATPRNQSPDGPTVSPQSRGAFREFATPPPVVYRGRCWRMNPASPLSPVMMELCPLLSAPDGGKAPEEEERDAAAAAEAPDARYYD